jgi:hypothetical protein
MDLIGKTVRWEGKRDFKTSEWFTGLVVAPCSWWEDGRVLLVVDPGTRYPPLRPDESVVVGIADITVIDSEPVTEDEECE